MNVNFDFSALGRSRWYEYVLRFVFRGVITAMTGIIAKRFGAEVGGLFLGFPAIFPAAATLIEKHERTRKIGQGWTGRTVAGRLLDWMRLEPFWEVSVS